MRGRSTQSGCLDSEGRAYAAREPARRALFVRICWLAQMPKRALQSSVLLAFNCQLLSRYRMPSTATHSPLQHATADGVKLEAPGSRRIRMDSSKRGMCLCAVPLTGWRIEHEREQLNSYSAPAAQGFSSA